MKAATVHELKKELFHLDHQSLVALCLRLARYKKENKELLTYLLFMADDEDAYVNTVKKEIDEQLENVSRYSVYRTRKNLRKILRLLDKYIRYSGRKATEAELRIHFCRQIREKNIPVHKSKVLRNLYERQVQKIRNAVSKLHEDLQYDFGLLLREIE